MALTSLKRIKVPWPGKNSHINYIMWDMIVIELCCDEMVTTYASLAHK
jgi:hypothetical protein